jgi:hypothetical protein
MPKYLLIYHGTMATRETRVKDVKEGGSSKERRYVGLLDQPLVKVADTKWSACMLGSTSTGFLCE